MESNVAPDDGEVTNSDICKDDEIVNFLEASSNISSITFDSSSYPTIFI